MRRLLLALGLASLLAVGAVADETPAPTREDLLLSRIAELQRAAAEGYAAAARCESNGPTAVHFAADYRETVKALESSLAERGLVRDPNTGQIKAKETP